MQAPETSGKTGRGWSSLTPGMKWLFALAVGAALIGVVGIYYRCYCIG